MGWQNNELNKKANIVKCYKEQEAGESHYRPRTEGTTAHKRRRIRICRT